MKKFTTLFAAMLLCLGLWAEVHVSGVVVDEKGEPVIGASIQVKGSTQGTISDYDGKFELDVPDDAKLVITFVGMQNQEVAAKPSVRVTLKENTEVIEEVVVTGYGNVTKGSFAGSAQAVKADDIEKKSPSEISKALAGEVAGVQVVNTSGQPGTNASIRIRGIGSINASSAPLYVVDGIAYDGDISSIDPGDIASTTILKDATATSLYGSRGANGVIVITTKKGSSGDEGKVDVDVKYGGNMRLLPFYDVISSPEEYVALAWQGMYNYNRESNNQQKAIDLANATLYGSNGIPEGYNLWMDPTTGKVVGAGRQILPFDGSGLVNPSFATDVVRRKGYENLESWRDAIFRVGQKAEATVKIHGGSDKVTYYTSFGYLKDEGYYQSSDFQRFNVRSNIEYKPKKWMKGTLNVSYNYATMNNPNQDGGGAMNNGFYYVNAVPPIYPVYERDANGNIAIDPRTGLNYYDYGENNNRTFGWGINPAGALRLDKTRSVMHQVTATGNLEFTLYDGLKLLLTAGAMYYSGTGTDLTNKFYGDAAGIGRILKSHAGVFTFEATEALEYNKTFAEHTISAFAAHETNYVNSSSLYGYKYDLARPDALELGNALKMSETSSSSATSTMESFLARVSYTYDDKYMITANYRADGSSSFGPGHRWGHFGSVGAAWAFTKESFMEPAKDWLHDGKLRLSWGVLGNQDIGSNLYSNLYSLEYIAGGVRGYLESYIGNSSLTWERSHIVDLGLEFELNKYLGAEIDYFYKQTDQMLFTRSVALSNGYGGFYTNDGKMWNQGVELQFNVHAVDTRNVKLDIRLNGSHYANQMTQMPVDYIDADGNEVRMVRSGGMSLGHSVYDYNMVHYEGVNEKGHATYRSYYDTKYGEHGASKGDNTYNIIYDLFVYEHENPDAVEEGRIQYIATEDYGAGTSYYVGKSAIPDFAGGFGISLEAYGATLDVTCSYGIGGYGYDNVYAALMGDEQAGSHNWHRDMLSSWTENNTTSQIPALTNGQARYANFTNSPSDRFLTSNSFLSLNNVRIGYNFPKKLIEKIKFKSLSLWVSGENLAIATARKGYNPMISGTGSSDTHQYTPQSTIMGGIKFTF